MNTQEFINLCHDAQHDAGSQIRFNEKVTAMRDRIGNGLPALVDPVAAFIAAILINTNGAIDEQIMDDFEYYTSELCRVTKAVSNLITSQ